MIQPTSKIRLTVSLRPTGATGQGENLSQCERATFGGGTWIKTAPGECSEARVSGLGVPHSHTCDLDQGHDPRYGHHCPLCGRLWVQPSQTRSAPRVTARV